MEGRVGATHSEHLRSVISQGADRCLPDGPGSSYDYDIHDVYPRRCGGEIFKELFAVREGRASDA